MNQTPYHIPALLAQTIDSLDIRPDGIYVDATFGGGGHSRGILGHIDTGHLYSFDRDSDAVTRAAEDPDFADNPRFTLIHGDFRYMRNFMRYHTQCQDPEDPFSPYGDVDATVDGILADLGVSFHHFDDEDRGFSFRYTDSDLDMRMNTAGGTTAADILNDASEQRLEEIFRLYGELPKARLLARNIVHGRGDSEYRTVGDLLDVISPLINPAQEKKELAQVFQALRIEVNGELDALRQMLTQAVNLLKPGGRLAVITYHSLEDRLVKNFIKTGNFEGKVEKDFYGRTDTPLKQLSSKPIVPDETEINNNPRSRSAKLRVAIKK